MSVSQKYELEIDVGMDTIKWKWWKDMNEMSWLMLCCEFVVSHCVYLFSSRQESVYLSLQSNLVTLQVLSASPLLQEFIPHLLHLSSRVQTLSSLQSHTVWWQFFFIRCWVSPSNRNHCSAQWVKMLNNRTVNAQRASVNLWAGFSCLATFHFFLRPLCKLSVTLGCIKKKERKKNDSSFCRENIAVCFQNV